MDSIVKLWELSSNRSLIAYTGAGATTTSAYGSTLRGSRMIFMRRFPISAGFTDWALLFQFLHGNHANLCNYLV